MARMRECPVCGIRVKLENLESHLKKVHPRAKVEETLTVEDKTAIKVATKKRKKQIKPFEDRERRRWGIVGVIIALAIGVLLILLAIQSPTQSENALKGEDAPLFEYGDVEGNPYDLNQRIGNKPILMEFLYTECGFCIKMAPNLNELFEYYDYGGEVEFVSISADDRDSVEDVYAFRESHGANWTFIKAPESLGDTYQVTGTPTFFIIDKSGVIVEVVVGLRGVEEMKEVIDPYL